jgi:hypothetical protein
VFLVFLAFLVFFFTNFLFFYIVVTLSPSTALPSTPLRDGEQSRTVRINGSFTLTINSSSILPTSTVHICSPINGHPISFTIKVILILRASYLLADNQLGVRTAFRHLKKYYKASRRWAFVRLWGRRFSTVYA